MFIYNVTIKVDNCIAEDWLTWLKEEHIPEVMETGCFTSNTILQILEIDDSEGPTYAIQYKVESKALYNNYLNKHAAVMRGKSFEKWGSQFIAYRSFMQIVN